MDITQLFFTTKDNNCSFGYSVNLIKKIIEIECDDDEFMAMFEQMPEFDDLDDSFVANEEQWTSMVAEYIDQNIERFAIVVE